VACQSKADWQAWNEDEIHCGGIGADFSLEPRRTAGARGICQADNGIRKARLLSGRPLSVRPPHFSEFVSGYDALRWTTPMLREAGSGKTCVAGAESRKSARAGKRTHMDQ